MILYCIVLYYIMLVYIILYHIILYTAPPWRRVHLGVVFAGGAVLAALTGLDALCSKRA